MVGAVLLFRRRFLILQVSSVRILFWIKSRYGPSLLVIDRIRHLHSIEMNGFSIEHSARDPLAGGEDASGVADTPFSLLEHLPIGLLVTDPDACIVFTNAFIERMLGYDRGALLGQSVEILVPERSRSGHVDIAINLTIGEAARSAVSVASPSCTGMTMSQITASCGAARNAASPAAASPASAIV